MVSCRQMTSFEVLSPLLVVFSVTVVDILYPNPNPVAVSIPSTYVSCDTTDDPLDLSNTSAEAEAVFIRLESPLNRFFFFLQVNRYYYFRNKVMSISVFICMPTLWFVFVCNVRLFQLFETLYLDHKKRRTEYKCWFQLPFLFLLFSCLLWGILTFAHSSFSPDRFLSCYHYVLCHTHVCLPRVCQYLIHGLRIRDIPRSLTKLERNLPT